MIIKRGEQLEDLLTSAFNSMQEAEEITKGKIDIPFLLNIVGSYITAKKDGTLLENARAPGDIFEERIIPIVDESTLEVEVIGEEEDGDTTTNTVA